MLNKLFLTLLCLFATIGSFAQTRSHEFAIQTDNDSYLGQGSDRYYTNGIFFYYRKALKANNDLQNKVLGFEIGQKMYNPQSGYVPNADFIDRPFAAYTYIGSTLNLLYKNEGNLKLSAQIGLVGPAAGGEPVQKLIHNTFGFYHLNGWQYQIRNDAELNLGAEYNKLLARASWIDVSLASYANLGNGFTGAGVGPLLRLGNFNQLFNSVSTQSTVSAQDQTGLLHAHEIFFYYKPQVNGVLYDATIQGSLLRSHDPNSQEVTLNKKPVIFSNQLGVAFTTSRFAFDIAAIFHTKDVEEMIRSHQWASITGAYRFK
ncbi:lipid A deacylase LpxR family protein [Mucilaginibacter aquaedulcis]|uniref:lipid A deacylase LpxR family protein n=1 Tax=Mucilaginibacter aquaedulcis TaxID=1187081 RepID=UPI0025B3535B|nr:lipid A deacylase LpxR family protein [Mucilaginibacter aquaedulcis]MDN3547529.1 lipid A deacylase LpxR family protein [Mucilaginibacter aquaedulcis]